MVSSFGFSPDDPYQMNNARVAGWRQAKDPMGVKPYWYFPTNDTVTWQVQDVLENGGLEDLLATNQWCLACADPQAAEVKYDANWKLAIYKTEEGAKAGDSDACIGHILRGEIFVVLRQDLGHQDNNIAMTEC